jgi:hypothetical protein
MLEFRLKTSSGGDGEGEWLFSFPLPVLYCIGFKFDALFGFFYRYCFVLNPLFSALLRSLPNPFTVSECGSRVYSFPNQDPAKEGLSWGPNNHVALLVDVENGERYLADVGFGGASSHYP